MISMRIASYNIRKAIGLDRKRDPVRIARVLRDVDADVVVLQEADRRLGRRPTALSPEIIRGETDYRIVDHAGSDVSLGWHGNAILVRDGIDCAPLNRIDLPGLEPRGAVLARCGDLTVVGTHLGLLRRHRVQQMEHIKQVTADFEPGRVLIAGDFNVWSDTQGFEPWSDTFDIIRPGRSFHSSRPIARLDGFAIGTEIYISEGGVHEKGDARMASDHLPVWVELDRRRADVDASAITRNQAGDLL